MGVRRTLLEGEVVDPGVEVDGVFPGDHVLQGRPLTGSLRVS